jgi:LPXTG-motif cell wall-anchored protein
MDRIVLKPRPLVVHFLHGSVGTPKEHVISVDVSMRGESGDPKVTEDTTNAETDLDQTLPKTGESSGYYPWLSLLLVSVGGLIFLAQRKRISQQRD